MTISEEPERILIPRATAVKFGVIGGYAVCAAVLLQAVLDTNVQIAMVRAITAGAVPYDWLGRNLHVVATLPVAAILQQTWKRLTS